MRVANVRDASTLHTALSGDFASGEIARSGFRRGSPAFDGAPGRDGRCAGRSQVAIALRAVTDGQLRIGSSAAIVPTVPVLGCLLIEARLPHVVDNTDDLLWRQIHSPVQVYQLSTGSSLPKNRFASERLTTRTGGAPPSSRGSSQRPASKRTPIVGRKSWLSANKFGNQGSRLTDRQKPLRESADLTKYLTT
jgi:hypothetical protein